MRRSLRPLLFVSSVALTLSLASAALAIEVAELGGEVLTADVTNTATLKWHFDNRNDSPGVASGQIDDRYGELFDKLNLQLGWWRFTLGVRIDTATYMSVTTAEEAQQLGEDAFLAGNLVDSTNGYYRELHSRFLDTYYPAKLSIGYTQPGIDATVGDFYTQLGRGLVLSVRKIDEVAIDTTVRGGKLVLDHEFGDLQVGATLLGGQLNPLRLDEPSGRRLHGDGSPLFFAYPEIGDFRYYAVDDPCPAGQSCFAERVDPARPNYLEDGLLGGRVEVGNRDALFAVNGSMLLRKEHTQGYLDCVDTCSPGDNACLDACTSHEFSPNDASREHATIRTFSGSVSFPSIAKTADVYLEVAGQQLRDGKVHSAAGEAEERADDLSGYAVYASANGRSGPFTLSLEGKHYRRFFPLSANIDVSSKTFGAPEFNVVSYNQPPTVEPTYVEQIGAPNICITGGMGRSDYRFDKEMSAFAWAGYYVSYSESDARNDTCDTSAKNRTDTWDTGIGSEMHFERGKTHLTARVGARITDRAEPSAANIGGTTAIFYREGYVRYDVVKHISGPVSLQLQGFHRHRYEPVSFADSWNEGENYTALQWAPHFVAAVGYEYLGRLGCDPNDSKLCHYVSGTLQWRSASSETALDQIFDTVQIYVGQQRGAIRCVSGVCRQFPPFEGAKLEVVSRF